MSDTSSRQPRRKRPPKPLDFARLEEMALAYVARFSTSAVRLERYLQRKLRERGWDGESEPPVRALAERYVELGYIDDEAFARARSGSLLRRGYGQRRVRQALDEAGIGEELRESVRPGERETRLAALTLARRRRFGPFGSAALDKPLREKQIAAMLRAGHPLDSARQIVDAASAAEAEQWATEVDDDEEI
jgi:regulatory protein